MKRFFLIVTFSASHLFLPFVMVNCGTDEAFVADSGNEATEEEQLTADDCKAKKFVTADCVKPLSEESVAEPARPGSSAGGPASVEPQGGGTEATSPSGSGANGTTGTSAAPASSGNSEPTPQ